MRVKTKADKRAKIKELLREIMNTENEIAFLTAKRRALLIEVGYDKLEDRI